jgi:hypothetical protein
MARLLAALVIGLSLLASLAATPARASTGVWERAWGKDVGGPGVGICIVAASCQGGTSGTNPGEFDTPNGVATDAAGNLYVGDTDQSLVDVFDPSGNFIRAWSSANRSADVAIGQSGNVYITEIDNNRVTEFSPTGTFMVTWGKNVGGSGVNRCDGTLAPCQPGVTGTANGEFGAGVGGLGTDSSGNVYVADTGNNRIQVFDAGGNFQRKWGGPGTDAGQLSSPSDVAVDSAGHVYVSEAGNNRIQQFDTAGAFVRAWGKDVGGASTDVCVPAGGCFAGTVGSKGGQFSQPGSVAADAAAVYVSDGANVRVQKFTSSGGFVRAWGKDVDPAKPGVFGICTAAASCRAGAAGSLGGEMNAQAGVAIGPGGALYLGEPGGNERVQKFAIGAPRLTGITPSSPANQNTPVVHGTGDPSTTVKVFGNSACSGSPLATGSDSALSSTGIPVPVPDDSTTTLFATTTDESSQTSGCSSTSATYVEDSTPPDTVIDSGPAGSTSSTTPTITYHATDSNSTFMCRFDAEAYAPCTGPGNADTPLFPLAAGAHTFDVFATDQAGNPDPTAAHAAFVVAPPLPPPVEGRRVNAIPESGTVLVKLPPAVRKLGRSAAAGFVPLASIGEQIPVGSTLDTSHGTVHLFAAANAAGRVQDGHFSGGLFAIAQGRKNPLTTLSMTGGGLSSCHTKLPPGGAPKQLSAARKARRSLFSNVHGHFSARGHNSVATVRGTQWSMTDTCAGTLTTVQRGTVLVRDLRLRKTRVVKAGHRYLARSLKK